MPTIIRRTTIITEIVEISDSPSAAPPAAPDVDVEGQELAQSRPGLRKCAAADNVVPFRRVVGGAR